MRATARRPERLREFVLLLSKECTSFLAYYVHHCTEDHSVWTSGHEQHLRGLG